MFIYISFYKFNSHKFDYKNIEKDIHDKKDVKLRGAKVLISLSHISAPPSASPKSKNFVTFSFIFYAFYLLKGQTDKK